MRRVAYLKLRILKFFGIGLLFITRINDYDITFSLVYNDDNDFTVNIDDDIYEAKYVRSIYLPCKPYSWQLFLNK